MHRVFCCEYSCFIGKFPYAALTEKDLLTMLKNGYRLEQPENCTDEM